ncbi:MAG: hypothetical protein RR314_00120 [Oscillospiraceae bacterium]
MKSDGFWELFIDTGDPLCWLMSRADGKSAGNTNMGGSESPASKHAAISGRDGASPSD